MSGTIAQIQKLKKVLTLFYFNAWMMKRGNINRHPDESVQIKPKLQHGQWRPVCNLRLARIIEIDTEFGK